MPTYTYACTVCPNTQTELRNPLSDEAVYCRTCGEVCTRQFPAPGAVKGPTKVFHRPPKDQDPGFQRDWSEVWD